MPKPSDMKIVRGGLVLADASSEAARRDILIQGDKIIAVEAPGFAVSGDAVLIDASGKLLMPGLVNSHTHGHGSLGKGLGDKWTLETYLSALPWVGGRQSLDDLKTASHLNAAEMILKGCTSAYDMTFSFPTISNEAVGAIGEAYRDLGVRVVLAPMMADRTLYQAIDGLLDSIPAEAQGADLTAAPASAQQHLAACRKMLETWPFDHNDVKPGLGPTIPLHCTNAFLIGCRDLSREFDVQMQMHLGESRIQAVSGIARYDGTLTAHLDKLGLLGPRFTGAHCIWLDDEDLKRFAGAGAKIAHSPGSNMRLGSGIAPARRMLDFGIALGIGSDGSAASDNQNMFEAMRAAAFVSRLVSSKTEDWLSVSDVFHAATAGGGQLMGFKDVGKLAPGYKADVVMLDLSNVNYVPFNNALNQVVWSEDSSAVDTVIAGGRIVLKGRTFVDFDYDALRSRVQSTVEALMTRQEKLRFRCDGLAAFVAAHCACLDDRPYGVERRLDYSRGKP